MSRIETIDQHHSDCSLESAEELRHRYKWTRQNLSGQILFVSFVSQKRPKRLRMACGTANGCPTDASDGMPANDISPIPMH